MLLLLSKPNKIAYSKVSAFASSALYLHLFFHFKLCSFCSQEVQEYFMPQGAEYRSYAIALSCKVEK